MTSAAEHDPEGGDRFSEKITLKQEAGLGSDGNLIGSSD
jgi:hypothetical protein